MSSACEPLHHPLNGHAEENWEGFSWPGFFFGVFWLLFKGLYMHFVLVTGAIVLFSVMTGGPGFVLAAPLSWLIVAVLGNGWHRQRLIDRGYLTPAQWAEQSAKSAPPPPAAAVASAPPAAERACPFCAESIKRAAIVCRYCGRDVPAL